MVRSVPPPPAAALASLGEVACLEVVANTPVGAFLHWGAPKDLLLPFAEQDAPPVPGEHQLVKVIADRRGRPLATARLARHLRDQASDLRQGERVDVLIAGATELGYKVVVNHTYWGLISAGECREPLFPGHRQSGYVQRLREDRRLSVSLHPPGAAKTEGLGEEILRRLEEHGGFLALGDKSSPEAVFRVLGCSKGAFKQAIGKLYKARRIAIEAGGIRRL